MKAPLAGLVVGIGIGVLLAGRTLRSLVYGAAPEDPLLVLGTAAVLLGTALLACLLPAMLAAKVQPSEALRGE
jgi:ABC-type antimicrobial peptide transport system permease subunit